MIAYNERKYADELFKRLSASPALKEQQGSLGSYCGKPVWWIIQRADKSLPFVIDNMGQQCSEVAAEEDRSAYTIRLCNAFNIAKKTKRLETFTCGLGYSGFCYPVAQGRKIYGYIAMCHGDKEIPKPLLEMFMSFIDTLVREIQKELQLSKLYETIRPRAIALSTVHTIHRLLTSTLDLDELLPRIARLSLQIVRANRCSIKLADKTKKVLLPKTTVDLRTKNVRLKKVKVGMYAPGKAFKSMKAIKGRDYMAVPLIDQDVIGVITLYDKIDKTPFGSSDEEIMSTLAEQAVIAINNAVLYKEQERMTEGTIKTLAALLDTRGPGGKLTPRAPFVKIVREIGKSNRLSPEELKALEYAYLLHDVGKALLPSSLLSKRSKLTGKEFRLLREHPLKGARILKPLKTLRESVPVILHQRERFDGNGYPDRLKGRKIPLGARIISVVSAFEAMTAKRPYHPKKSVARAREEIKKNSGTQFDPKIVDKFLKVTERRHIVKMLRREGYGT